MKGRAILALVGILFFLATNCQSTYSFKCLQSSLEANQIPPCHQSEDLPQDCCSGGVFHELEEVSSKISFFVLILTHNQFISCISFLLSLFQVCVYFSNYIFPILPLDLVIVNQTLLI